MIPRPLALLALLARAASAVVATASRLPSPHASVAGPTGYAAPGSATGLVPAPPGWSDSEGW